MPDRLNRVAIAGFLHESNTFLSVPTRTEDFRSTSWTEGDALLARWSGALHELGGLVDGCGSEGLEPVPLLATFAVPSGTVVSFAFEEIAERITGLLRVAMPVGGVLLALHGATVSEEYPDADGEILSRVRAIVGNRIPLIATLDLHANVSKQMVDHSDALICYRSNPHVDQRERGLEAVRLIGRTLRGEVRPVQAAMMPPWIIPIDRQYTAQQPAKGLYEDVAEAVRHPGILSASVAMGFYYADVEEMGAAFLAVADGDLDLATQTAAWMASRAWARRQSFEPVLVSVEDAVARAASAVRTPVALFDTGDNVGGGSPGDSTILLAEILRQRVPNCLVVLHDPEAVNACVAAGVRSRVHIRAGGKTDNLHGAPVPIEGTIRVLADGLFVEREVRHGGWGFNDQGITAVVETDDETTIILTSRRMAPMSLQQVLSAGVAPQNKQAIVVKGVVAPRAAYEPICSEILIVDTAGVTAVDPGRFHYRRRRSHLYPLEADVAWEGVPAEG